MNALGQDRTLASRMLALFAVWAVVLVLVGAYMGYLIEGTDVPVWMLSPDSALNLAVIFGGMLFPMVLWTGQVFYMFRSRVTQGVVPPRFPSGVLPTLASWMLGLGASYPLTAVFWNGDPLGGYFAVHVTSALAMVFLGAYLGPGDRAPLAVGLGLIATLPGYWLLSPDVLGPFLVACIGVSHVTAIFHYAGRIVRGGGDEAPEGFTPPSAPFPRLPGSRI